MSNSFAEVVPHVVSVFINTMCSAYIISSYFDAAPSSPRSVRVVSTSNLTISIEWRPPAHGDIRSYIVTYFPVDNINFFGANQHVINPSHEYFVRSITIDAHTYLIRDLTPYTNYSITVTASNNSTLGESSIPIYVRTLESGMYVQQYIALQVVAFYPEFLFGV